MSTNTYSMQRQSLRLSGVQEPSQFSSHEKNRTEESRKDERRKEIWKAIDIRSDQIALASLLHIGILGQMA